MTRINTFLTYVLSAFMLMMIGFSSAFAQNGTANLQIIHNSPDPAVSSVDIFVNGDEFLTDVDFRAATAFTEVPAGVELNIQIAPAGTGIDAAVGPFTYTLEEDENYVVIASGVVDEESYPDAQTFSLEVFTPALTEADDPSTVAVNIHHGSPDAPAVDIYVTQVEDGPAVSDLSYPEFTGYIELTPINEVVGLAETGGDVLVEFEAPFADLELGGYPILVLASGFFSSDYAGEDNAIGLLAVLPDGTTEFLNLYEENGDANVQIIHNSADPAAASVDIFVNGQIALPGVEFRTATEFINLPGDTPLDIVVTPADAGIDAGIEFEGVEFSAGGYYYVVATGVLNPDEFAENPDGVDTNFFLDVIANASVTAEEDNFDFLLYHGATDAPAVDVAARDVAVLAENVSYTDYTSDYISVPADSYVIDVFAAGGDTPLVSFDADVSPLGGSTGIILASGFLNPSANNDGPAFGVIVALPDGSVVELGMATSSEELISDRPDQFELNQNYPNPFNPATTISYTLPVASEVRIDVFNVTGQQIATIVDTRQSAGQYTVQFDASALSSGVYLYRIQADNFTQTKRMTLIK